MESLHDFRPKTYYGNQWSPDGCLHFDWGHMFGGQHCHQMLTGIYITYKMLPGCPPIRIQHFHLRCNIEKYEDIHDIMQLCVFYMRTHPTTLVSRLYNVLHLAKCINQLANELN